MNEQTIRIAGKTVHYWELGAEHARALLLLHGIGDAHANWSGVMPTLAEHFHVIAPDLPGFGKSAPLVRSTIDGLLAWMQQLIEGLEREQMAIVGHSFGALLTRLYSAAYPRYVPAAVLVNGGTIPNVPAQLRWIGRLPVIGSSVFLSVARSTLGKPEHMVVNAESMNADFAAQTLANLSGFATMMRLLTTQAIPEQRTPPVPTLLLWGAADGLTTLDEAERIKATIPGAQLSPIAGCGHLPQLEAPDVFAWQVVQFVENLNRPSSTNLPGVGRLQG
jgi:pimeloyl-ACP methyl ester carboxylesterase